jgi:hypothetical protein
MKKQLKTLLTIALSAALVSPAPWSVRRSQRTRSPSW